MAQIKGEVAHVVDAPHFYAAAWSVNGKIHDAAPILRYAVGWTVDRLRAYCLKKGWKIVDR